MKKPTFVLLIAILGMTVLMTGFWPNARPTPEAKLPKAALVINGTLGDKSFFDSAAEGINRAEEELGIEARIIECGGDPSKWEPALEDAAIDYDIVIAGTWQMKEHVEKIAPNHPDKKFIIFDTEVDYSLGGLDNVYSVLYKQNEGSFLAGALAAMVTGSDMPLANPEKVIGAVGGMDIPVINDFIIGYEQGARHIDPEVEVLISYAGTFFDPAKGKELALAQYNQGADIVFNVAASTGLGLLEAAKEQNRYAIGVDSDQALLFEESDPQQAEHILTSMLKRVDNSLFLALKRHVEDSLPYGKAEALGLKEKSVGLAKNKWYEEQVPDEIKDKIDELEKKILDGEIVVDTAFK